MQPDHPPNVDPLLIRDLKMDNQHSDSFTTLSQFGTALDIGMEELLIESYFPADETTRRFFLQAQN